MSDELLDEWSVNHTLPKEEAQLISVGATLRMIAFFFDFCKRTLLKKTRKLIEKSGIKNRLVYLL